MTEPLNYSTEGSIRVTRRATDLPFDSALDEVIAGLDARCGALLGSDYEYPNRYARWGIGFVDPPLRLTTRGNRFSLAAANARGEVLLSALRGAIVGHPHVREAVVSGAAIEGEVIAPEASFDEAARTRQPSVFSVVRAVIAAFASREDRHLGLYGAFGYDLIYQVEPIESLRERPDDQRDLVAFLPDSIVVLDHQRQSAVRYDYEFEFDGRSTAGLPRATPGRDFRGARLVPPGEGDLAPGEYADLVREAMPYFRRGDLFEVVPSRSIYEACEARPSDLFRTLRRINPSPYTFLLNLDGEYLVGASPEIFVRTTGRRVETCPISGTIPRGGDAIEDAERIRSLLNSRKDEAELTMCTDVDRNDKSRVCVPGTVRVVGRRQIELYSHLIHTVDHVEGTLAEGSDGLDAFLSHAWAVTVTGAPKRAAVTFIERHERTVRRWYGGAIGWLGFNGDVNTGLTLRTIRLKDSVAEVRVGATLLADSIPQDEEDETTTKAAAMRAALGEVRDARAARTRAGWTGGGAHAGKRVLMVDCEDSFVHTLASYFRATGASMSVLRHDVAGPALAEGDWDLVVFSPGPGSPSEFGVPDGIRACVRRGVPVFGVCLGMQGIAEAFGGTLGTLPVPSHGKPGQIVVTERRALFAGLPDRFTGGRYHSLFADPETLPSCLVPTARTEDGVIMALEHDTLPVAGVQFHPESIMTAGDDAGYRIVGNVMARLARQRAALLSA
jgi:anthranilate synthase